MRRAAPANWSNLPNRTVAFLHGLDPKPTLGGGELRGQEAAPGCGCSCQRPRRSRDRRNVRFWRCGSPPSLRIKAFTPQAADAQSPHACGRAAFHYDLVSRKCWEHA